MSKLFYVVVPFYLIDSTKQGLFERVMNSIKPRKGIYHKREQFETYKNQLFQRVEEIKEALSGSGVRMVPLNTQELIEMYYNYYNPSEFEHIAIPELESLDIENSSI